MKFISKRTARYVWRAALPYLPKSTHQRIRQLAMHALGRWRASRYRAHFTALGDFPFNENRYLELNPDVQQLILDGHYTSGLERFVKWGALDLMTGTLRVLRNKSSLVRNHSRPIKTSHLNEMTEARDKKYSSPLSRSTGLATASSIPQ
jgi:hypothetical protein